MKLSLLEMCDNLAKTWREWEANIDSRGTMIKGTSSSDYGECAVMLENILDHHRAALAQQAQPRWCNCPGQRNTTKEGHFPQCPMFAQQAQPLTDRERDEAFEELRRSALRMAAECDDAGCAASNMIRVLITAYDVRAAEARDRMAQQAQHHPLCSGDGCVGDCMAYEAEQAQSLSSLLERWRDPAFGQMPPTECANELEAALADTTCAMSYGCVLADGHSGPCDGGPAPQLDSIDETHETLNTPFPEPEAKPTLEEIAMACCKAWEGCGCDKPCAQVTGYKDIPHEPDNDDPMDFKKMAVAVHALYNKA